jgi:hypothetical protein
MSVIYKPHPIPLVQHLTTNGLYNGTRDMAVDGDPTPVEFYIQPPAGWIFVLHRMLIHIEDDRAGWSPDVYAALGSALTNGVTMQYKDDNQVFCHFTTDVDPIKQNSHFSMLMFDTRLDVISVGSPTNAVYSGRFTFAKFGKPLVLDGDGDNMRFSWFINDDLATVFSQEVVVEGQAFQKIRGPIADDPRCGPGGSIRVDDPDDEVGLWY